MIEDIVQHKYRKEMQEGKEWFDMEHFIDFEIFTIIKEAWSQNVPKEKQINAPDWAEIVGTAREQEQI